MASPNKQSITEATLARESQSVDEGPFLVLLPAIACARLALLAHAFLPPRPPAQWQGSAARNPPPGVFLRSGVALQNPGD